MEYTKEQYLNDLKELKTKLEGEMEGKAKDIVDAQIAAINSKIEGFKGLPEGITEETLKQMQSDLQKTIDDFDKWQVKMNAFVKGGAPAPKQEQKSFNEILAETIEANIDEIKSYKSGDKKTFRLKGFEDEKIKEVKAVGDMSISANFTGASNWTTDVRNDLIVTPYNRVWLDEVLPSGTSNQSQSVLYPKEAGGEGGAAAWTDKTQDKAQMDFDLEPYSAYFKWNAGTVTIDREMLDDIPFMQSYIQNKMLISLKTSRNGLIIDGTSDTNPMGGIDDVATAYAAGAVTYTNPVDKIMDAAWGQIPAGTNDFYNPNLIILHPRDAVVIGLNKATGSGEYDLPMGSVAWVNGRLTIGGLQVVTTTQVSQGTFYVLDRNALMFIRRMAPELRMFEDATLAKKNKILFRIEERVTLATFNALAIVKGTL